MSKSEVVKELEGRGDFVQIDYLTRFIEEGLPRDMKKFAYAKLAEIYAKRHMTSEAAKTYGFIADLSITFEEKIQFNIKQVELYIQAGQFDRADECIQTALRFANASQRPEIMLAIKEFYKRQAAVYEKERRRAHAAKLYEKLAGMKILSESEKEDVKEKLLNLYEQLGKVREYQILKGKFD